jgi:NAD+ synthase
LGIDLTIDPKEVSTVIKDFIKTYVENSGCKGVVIGLSGGVDSAVTAILCQETLGKNKTNCLFLPDETTPKNDSEYLELLLKKFNLSCEKIDISDVVKQIKKNCIFKPDKYALANVKARVRMVLLFEYANMTANLVCGTSNKSELLVGYFTKYGDGGVDIFPIGDLYKTQVWKLAKFLKIPKEIISKSPTAGLWHGQFDEKELKLSYDKIDQILTGLEQKIDLNDIVKLVDVKFSDVKRIKNMRVETQHKRRSPLIPKIGLRTPGNDWRSPVQIG